MIKINKINKSLLLATLAASLGLGLMNAASAAPDQHFVHAGYVHTESRGWHGDRYYDGHRYWDRHEWERRHPPHHDEPLHHG